jgi:hypothetical protein
LLEQTQCSYRHLDCLPSIGVPPCLNRPRPDRPDHDAYPSDKSLRCLA